MNKVITAVLTNLLLVFWVLVKLTINETVYYAYKADGSDIPIVAALLHEVSPLAFIGGATIIGIVIAIVCARVNDLTRSLLTASLVVISALLFVAYTLHIDTIHMPPPI